MNLPLDSTAATGPLHPELWLLLSEPATAVDDAESAAAQLNALATTDALAAWRQRHRRVRSVLPDALDAALRSALTEGCPAVHLHASLAPDALADAVDGCHLPPGAERLLNLHGWGQPLPDWWPALAHELTLPDAWVEVGWRLSRGLHIPSVALVDEPGSAVGHLQAFKAWRAKRFAQGDSGLIAGDDEDGVAEVAVKHSGNHTDDNDDGADADPDADRDADGPPTPAATWRLPPQRGAGGQRLGVGHMGASSALGASSPRAAPWFPVAVLDSHAQAPGADQPWPCTLHIERQSSDAQGPWLTVRVRLQWPASVADQARRHAHRVCLLPRLQSPAMTTVQAGAEIAYFKVRDGAMARMKAWAQALPGTPASLVSMPMP